MSYGHLFDKMWGLGGGGGCPLAPAPVPRLCLKCVLKKCSSVLRRPRVGSWLELVYNIRVDTVKMREIEMQEKIRLK
jgi:hypothetical protein